MTIISFSHFPHAFFLFFTIVFPPFIVFSFMLIFVVIINSFILRVGILPVFFFSIIEFAYFFIHVRAVSLVNSLFALIIFSLLIPIFFIVLVILLIVSFGLIPPSIFLLIILVYAFLKVIFSSFTTFLFAVTFSFHYSS